MPFTYNYEKDDSVFCPYAHRECTEQLCYLCEDCKKYFAGIKDVQWLLYWIIFDEENYD